MNQLFMPDAWAHQVCRQFCTVASSLHYHCSQSLSRDQNTASKSHHKCRNSVSTEFVQNMHLLHTIPFKTQTFIKIYQTFFDPPYNLFQVILVVMYKSQGSPIKDHQNFWSLVLSLQVYAVWCTVTFVGFEVYFHYGKRSGHLNVDL